MDVNIPCISLSVGLSKWRPIHAACEFGKSHILKLLLNAKANPELYVDVIKSELIEPIVINQSIHISNQTFNIFDTFVYLEAWNPLHLAVIHGHMDCLDVLLKDAKVFVDSRSTISRKTALILAAELCDFEMIKILLEFGADPNAQDVLGKSPLFYAAVRGMSNIIALLLNYGANPNLITKRHQMSPLHASCMSRNADSLSGTFALIKAAPNMVHWKSSCNFRINNLQLKCLDMNCFLLSVLVTAICVDDHQFNLQIEKIKFLLVDQNADVDSLCTLDDVSENNTLHLLLVVVKKFKIPLRMELIEILLNHSINVDQINSLGESVLFNATRLNLIGLVNSLLKKNVNPNIGLNHTMTPLIFSIHKRYKQITKALVTHGANINQNICLQNFMVSNIQLTNCTAIHIALIYSDEDTFQFLLDNGANPFSTTDILSGRDVETNIGLLHLAILLKSNSVNYINKLLKIGLDIESKSSHGNTPFLFAVKHSNNEACRLFLSMGCNKHIINKTNQNGLIIAAINKNSDLMKCFLGRQLDICKQDINGFTSLHHCFIQDFRVGIDFFLHNTIYNLIDQLNVNVSSFESKITFLVLALQFGSEADVLELLKHGADPNCVFIHNDITMTPLFLAVELNSLDNMCHLYKYGADLNYISSPNHETLLHVALRNKNVAIAKELIFAGINLNVKSNLFQGEQVLPIHVAVQSGLDEIIELLICFGSSLNSTMILKSVEQVSSLHLAALNDQTSTVKFLTSQQFTSVHINSSRTDSFNALLTLVSKKNVQGVEAMLIAGADVNSKCIVSRSRNATCLHIAAQVGSFEIVRLLLEYGADPLARMITGDRDGILPIHLATESGHLEIVNLFFDWGVPVYAAEDCGLTCLHYAANAGCIDILEMLLKAGADVNAEATDGNRSKMLPLHMAAEKGHKKSVKLLLEYGSSIDAVFSRVNRDNLTALYIATSENREDVMKYLIKCGANSNIQENNLGAAALHITCQRGFTKVISYLIGIANCSLNIPLHTGISSLHLTAEKGHNELSFWLLRCKCDPNVKGQITDSYSKKTSYDISPLNQACGFGHLTVVKLLIKSGADINWAETFEGHRGIKPIHCAAIRGRYHIVSTLLEAGVNINELDEDGRTPLHWSVIERFYDCTKVLIELKADVNIIDKNGKRPVDYALTANLISLF